MDLITNLDLNPGDVVEIKSRVTVTEASTYNSAGTKLLKGTANGQPFRWIYDAMESVTVLSRKPTHPTPRNGDIWVPNIGMVPVYYNGQTFHFPAGMARSVTPTGTMDVERFFRLYRKTARFVVNTKTGDGPGERGIVNPVPDSLTGYEWKHADSYSYEWKKW